MPRPIENTERVSTFITKEQHKLLKKKAKDKGMTTSGFIRLLIIEEVGVADTILDKVDADFEALIEVE